MNEKVFIPAGPWMIQQPNIEGETGLCGFFELIKREEELRLVRNSAVRSMY